MDGNRVGRDRVVGGILEGISQQNFSFFGKNCVQLSGKNFDQKSRTRFGFNIR
jgi:hypothetical protein